ncbi:MAG TPA: lipid-A-disaccharide synthase [Thiotrichales bacterium]|nr:lipid-A-disaccharide synthase [Thiotrichales bacterium]
MSRPLKIGIIAGEASGDLLGAGLIEAIRARVPDARFEGIGGPRMQALGCESLYPMERLSVMGLIEPLRHLPGLLAMRRALVRRFLESPPDVFVGIDAPDFNLALERRLKAAGIPTVHYVSPSVWAWRRYRVRKIARSLDRMLTLFPFEADFYREHRVPVTFVGHPLADLIPMHTDTAAARRQLGLPEEGPLVALLPGSRMGEVGRLAGPFIEAARWCRAQRGNIRFAAAFANASTRKLFEDALQGQEEPDIRLLDGQARVLMAAADAVLVASGTATLEAMLIKRPMVVAYRMAPLGYRLARMLVKLPWYSLPNLLAGERLVPEFIQDEATGEALGAALLHCLEDQPGREAMLERFAEIHARLRGGASTRAAAAVLEVAGR